MFKWFIKGSLVGIANIIPGVSGGTMAVVLSIYDPLISAISNSFSNWKQLKSQLPFLCCVGAGAILGIGAFSKLIVLAFETYPLPTRAFLLGVLIGGIPILFRSHKNMRLSLSKLISMLTGATIMALFLVVSQIFAAESMHTEPHIIVVAVSCFFAAGAMIIPGISGSLLLLVLGCYEFVLAAVSDLMLSPLAIIGISSLAGVAFCSKLMSSLIKTYPGFTYYFLIGMIISSTYALWPSIPHFNQWNLLILSQPLCILLGYFFTRKLS